MIRDLAALGAGWIVLLLLLIGLFLLEPQRILVSAIAATGTAVLFVVAERGHLINTEKVLCGAPQQIATFSLGMYIAVYGLHNTGFTEYLSGMLNLLVDKGLWAVTLGTGFLMALLSSVMNNMSTMLTSMLSVGGSTAAGVVKGAMVYTNTIGCDLDPKIIPIDSLAILLRLHVLAQKNMTVTQGYYFHTGIVVAVPVLFITLAVLAWRPFITL